jgi:hypothetical protein
MSRQMMGSDSPSRHTTTANKASRTLYRLAALTILFVSATGFAAQPKFRVIEVFDFTDGAHPGPLIADQAGNLYGTTFSGGSGAGAVVELSPPAQPGGSWTERILYTFNDIGDGFNPTGSLAMDAHGNLFGTTAETSDSYGEVFELTKHSDGTYTFSQLYSFTGGADGGLPGYGVIIDASGNLYGETGGGGNSGCLGLAFGCGVVFEVSPSASGWTERVLYSFQSSGAYGPTNSLVLRDGNLYGTTGLGSGSNGNAGVVFELSPSDGGWNYTELYGFQGGSDGGQPGPISFSSNGNLYGTTPDGGSSSVGTVFELTPPTGGTGLWNKAVLHSFAGGADGNDPFQVVPGPNGKLYGVTYEGGNVALCPDYSGCGAVFKLTNHGGTWSNTTISITGEVFQPRALTLVGQNIFGPISTNPNVTLAGAVFEVTGFMLR